MGTFRKVVMAASFWWRAPGRLAEALWWNMPERLAAAEQAISEANAAIGVLSAELEACRDRIAHLESEARKKEQRPALERLVF